jgi:hypothetical protein
LPEKSSLEIQNLNDKELGDVLSKVAIVRAWASAVEAEALTRLLKDHKIPGYKLVEGRANRAWVNEDAVNLQLLVMGFEEDEVAPRELLSPAKVETLLKKSKRSKEWDKIAPLVTRPPGKLAIAPVIDPRPEITRGSEFKEVEYDNDD